MEGRKSIKRLVSLFPVFSRFTFHYSLFTALIIFALSLALAGSAQAVDKLVVKDAGGTNTVFRVDDFGTVEVPNGFIWDNVNKRLGINTITPDNIIQVKKDQNAVTALRVENSNIFGASAPLAQEQFVLGSNGSEHIIFQVLSDSHASMPRVALMNAYTHDFYIRTNAANVFKVIRTGAVADTLVLNTGLIGIGTASPTQKLDINSDGIRIRTAKTPASATAACNQGDMSWDANFVYVCVAANTWKRSALASW